MQRREWLAAAAVAVATVAALAACSRSDPERELRATIDSMARALEQRRPGDFLDAVADDFTRESGAFGKAAEAGSFWLRRCLYLELLLPHRYSLLHEGPPDSRPIKYTQSMLRPRSV